MHRNKHRTCLQWQLQETQHAQHACTHTHTPLLWRPPAPGRRLKICYNGTLSANVSPRTEAAWGREGGRAEIGAGALPPSRASTRHRNAFLFCRASRLAQQGARRAGPACCSAAYRSSSSSSTAACPRCIPHQDPAFHCIHSRKPLTCAVAVPAGPWQLSLVLVAVVPCPARTTPPPRHDPRA